MIVDAIETVTVILCALLIGGVAALVWMGAFMVRVYAAEEARWRREAQRARARAAKRGGR